MSYRTKTFVIALVLCLAFYGFVHQPFMRHSILHTYTTEHATEYAIVGLFLWAATDLALCSWRCRREGRALKYRWLPARSGIEPVSSAQDLYLFAYAAPKEMHDSMIFRRVMAAITYVRERESAAGFREYLNDLAERDAEATYARYGFPRFTTGVLPILGLLGTVVHFGGALNGLSSEDLVTKVPQIVSGMGTAFNTTCAALSASTTAMLFRFLMESYEESLVRQVNDYVADQLLHRFVADEEADNSEALVHTLQQLSQQLESMSRSDKRAA